ncbi:unnamed protein product [Parascedosporium putredinis]|uniref:Flavoprotein domain-containing protein n=1 Tax=Parascedosporium putredinis TaxID=1442378 RepID=A0A9P1H7I9_9PEZI|nr:unnamed protein product [Parascedosporium putredinis]CAI7999885.1 unnamed protein product [Parascedosporium putredinis]
MGQKCALDKQCADSDADDDASEEDDDSNGDLENPSMLSSGWLGMRLKENKANGVPRATKVKRNISGTFWQEAAGLPKPLLAECNQAKETVKGEKRDTIGFHRGAYGPSTAQPPLFAHPRPSTGPLNVLIAATGSRETSWAEAIIVRLSKNPHIRMRAVLDDVTTRISQTVPVMPNHGSPNLAGSQTNDYQILEHPVNHFQPNDRYAAELIEWTNLLVLAPLSADGIAKMLAGITDNTVILEVLRGWDVSKKILLVPGMSKHSWDNPMTKKHLTKVQRKWNCIRVMPPSSGTSRAPPDAASTGKASMM